MLTVQDVIELSELKKDFECWSLLAEQYPQKLEYKKHVDALELMIINIEADNRRI